VGRRPRAEGAAAAAPAAVLHVYPCEDGRWAWLYRQTASGFVLCSNLTYDTQDEAVEHARLAYPDLPFTDEG
jgi:hypothetical protein